MRLNDFFVFLIYFSKVRNQKNLEKKHVSVITIFKNMLFQSQKSGEPFFGHMFLENVISEKIQKQTVGGKWL